MRDKLKDNPVRAAGGITGAILSLATALADWGIESLPTTVPDGVTSAAYPLIIAVAALVAERVGKLVQRRFTEPKDVVANLIRRANGDPTAGGKHAQAMAGGTDPHGPALNASAAAQEWTP